MQMSKVRCIHTWSSIAAACCGDLKRHVGSANVSSPGILPSIWNADLVTLVPLGAKPLFYLWPICPSRKDTRFLHVASASVPASESRCLLRVKYVDVLFANIVCMVWLANSAKTTYSYIYIPMDTRLFCKIISSLVLLPTKVG